ncbi:hypothetical protein CMI48_00595 [Candidatus Pacearchaeota archaeon]|jgi:predicted nucleotidyltransferase|nr:hypothetical protein [Candidatus Pacearchaeota archaeon]|tara:strand:+ start:54 stop:818 length:765 start_codon:yes stop_codon:yes gene_type:complete
MLSQETLTKPIVKLGNSAGVLLPRAWLGGQAKIQLTEKPKNIKADILRILEAHLEDIKGIYITGSHARNEATPDSDVDVLVITEKTSKPIKQDPYEMILITKEELEEELEEDLFPLYPMIAEAKAILNRDLLQRYKKTKITKKNLRRKKEMIISALKITKGFIEMDKEDACNTGDSIAYSLILNLRTIEIIKALKRKEILTKKTLLQKIKTLTGSTEAYQGYLRIKNQKKEKGSLPIKEAEALQAYIEKEVRNI